MRKLLIFGIILLTVQAIAEPRGRYNTPPVVSFRLEQGVAGKEGADIVKSGHGWLWTVPGDKTLSSLTFDLDELGINPAFYDEIQIRFRCRQSLVMMAAQLQAYPVPDLYRNWYSKVVINPGEWCDWRMDMGLDDDSNQYWRTMVSDGRKLKLTNQKRYLRIPGEPATREVEIAEVRFLRRPVDMAFSEIKAEVRRENGVITWQYNLEFFNRELAERTVDIRLDTGRLKNFTPSWRSTSLTLKPRERRSLPLALSMAESAAAGLPPLYSESILPYFKIRGMEELPEFYPVYGYRPRLIWAVVPPARRIDLYQAPPETQRQKIIADADKALNESWAVPEFGPAMHPSDYYDKKNNSSLRAVTWYRHRSAKTGEDMPKSQLTNQGYVMTIHTNNFKRAALLGQAWRLTGNNVYAEAARDVFLEYARVYPVLPMAGSTATAYRTRLGQSTLMTSFWFAAAIDAYAVIHDSGVMSDADREIIENDFFAPEMDALYGHNVEYTNMQVHHFQVYTRTAAVLDRHWNLVGDALYGDHGYYAMIERSFSEDGMAQEGNVYHIFTLKPLLDFAGQMRSLGIPLMNRRFKRIFDGAVENTPDGIVRGYGLAHTLLPAWEAYRDVRYLPTLRYHKLLDEPGGEPLTLSSVQPNNGFLWLREKSDYGFRAMSLNYIMALDREEYDRLHFNLYDPELIATEVWRLNYGSVQGDMGHTVSHNTVTVDLKRQEDVAAELAAFLKRPRMPGGLLTENTEAPLYPGVRFSRAAAIFDGIMFVGDLLESDTEHTYDWPLYSVWEPNAHKDAGWFKFPFALKKAEIGYPFMTDAESAPADNGFSVTYGVPDIPKGGLRAGSGAPTRLVRATFAGIPGAEVFNAKTPRGFNPQPGPVMLLREKGKSAVFGAAFEVLPLQNAAPRVKSVEVLHRDGVSGAWLVTADSGRYLVIVNRTGRELKVNAIKTDQKLEVIKL